MVETRGIVVDARVLGVACERLSQATSTKGLPPVPVDTVVGCIGRVNARMLKRARWETVRKICCLIPILPGLFYEIIGQGRRRRETIAVLREAVAKENPTHSVYL